MTVCDEAGIAVPDEVAVLGIDNDDVQCELCNPPLSSVDPNVERIGYEAAALLDRMIARRAAAADPRSSSSRWAWSPAARPTCWRSPTATWPRPSSFVREHACEPGIEIEDLLARLSFSRATLNRWFRKWLGRSPSEEIARVRLNRVHDLLATTDLPLEKIARRCGFRHVESMCRMVKRMHGADARRIAQREYDEMIQAANQFATPDH